jgi:hypothetical protein
MQFASFADDLCMWKDTQGYGKRIDDIAIADAHAILAQIP